ncbi:MAG: SPOR domain-containing protein [Mangrovibacterium sp.]
MKGFIIKISLLGVFFIFAHQAQSQEMSSDSLSKAPRNYITQEASVSLMLDTYIKDCKANESAGFPGYRVQILSLTGAAARDQVLQVRNQFKSLHAEYPIYMEYKSPSFRLTVGDCRSRSEALYIKDKIKRSYPNAFVVFDKIQYPQLITSDMSEGEY